MQIFLLVFVVAVILAVILAAGNSWYWLEKKFNNIETILMEIRDSLDSDRHS